MNNSIKILYITLLSLAIAPVSAMQQKPSIREQDLHLASEIGNLKSAQYLINTIKIDPNVQNYTGSTPLLLASTHGHINIVSLLLATEGVDSNIRNKIGWTPLFIAAFKGYAEIVDLLIKSDAVIEQSTIDFTIHKKHTEILRLLIRARALRSQQRNHLRKDAQEFTPNTSVCTGSCAAGSPCLTCAS